MPDDVNKPRTAANWRGAVAVLLGTPALGAADTAAAHDRKKYHHHHHAPPGYVVVPPGHVHYDAPAPIVVR